MEELTSEFKQCHGCKYMKNIYMYGLCKRCYDEDVEASDHYDEVSKAYSDFFKFSSFFSIIIGIIMSFFIIIILLSK